MGLPRLPAPFRAIRRIGSRNDVIEADANGLATIFKCLPVPTNPPDLERLRREYLLLQAVAHPCWARPQAFGELPDGGAYLRLDRARGEVLSETNGLGIGWNRDALEICRRILSGLEALHRVGAAHLDLKPEQILLDSGSNPMELTLVDLGLAAPIGEAAPSAGTWGYIAPEVYVGRPAVDVRMDLYSFGVVLYQIVTGDSLFRAQTLAELLRQQLESPSLERIPSQTLRRYLATILAPDPRQRPATASEVWCALREILPETSVVAPPPLITAPRFSFFGRQSEMQRVHSWLAHAAQHTGQSDLACVLVGEPGIGKRRLAERIAARCATDGWEVTESDGSQWESGRDGGRYALLQKRSYGEKPPWRLRLEGRNSASTSEDCELAAVGPSMKEGANAGSVLALALAPLPLAVMTALVRSRDIESGALVDLLARASLGSPALLDAALAEIPSSVSQSSHYFDDLNARELLRELKAPSVWVEWARGFLDSLAAEDADALMSTALSADENVGLLSGPVRTYCLARGLLIERGNAVQFRHVVWQRAFREADLPRARRLAQPLLRRWQSASSRRLVELFDLTLELELFEESPLLFEPALRKLHAHSRYEELLDVLDRGIARQPDLFDVLTTDFWALLASIVHPVAFPKGRSLPERVERDSFPGLDPFVVRILRAWRLACFKHFDDALSVLEPPDPAAEPRHLFSWVALWIGIVRLHDRERLDAARLQMVLPYSDPEHRPTCELLEMELWMFTSDSAQREIGRRLAPQGDRFCPGTRAHLYYLLASRGQNLDVSQRYRYHQETIRLTEEHGLKRRWRYAVQNASVSMIDDGRLEEGRRLCLQGVREAARKDLSHLAALNLANLANVELLKGQLGLALRATEDGLLFGTRSGRSSNMEYLTFVRAESLLDLGALEEGCELLESPFGPTYFVWPLSLARAWRGELDGARADLACHLEAEGAEVPAFSRRMIAVWQGICCELGARDAAVEAHSWFKAATPRGRLDRSLGLLYEGEMLALGWLESKNSDHATQVLCQAVTDLVAMGAERSTWIGLWRLGQLLHRRDPRDPAAIDFYREAGLRLSRLAESTHDARRAASMLRRPSPRVLISELQALESRRTGRFPSLPLEEVSRHVV